MYNFKLILRKDSFMSKKYNIDSLDSLKGLAEKIKNNPVRSEYWEEEEKFIVEIVEKRAEKYKMIEMGSEKYHTSFSL